MSVSSPSSRYSRRMQGKSPSPPPPMPHDPNYKRFKHELKSGGSGGRWNNPSLNGPWCLCNESKLPTKDHALFMPHMTSAHNETDDDSEDSEDDISSKSSNDEDNSDEHKEPNNTPQNNNTIDNKRTSGHQLVHLPSLCNKMSSFCVCHSCLMEQIPQTIEDLVKKIFTDVKEERIDDVSADEFANKWLKKNTYIMEVLEKLCSPVGISDENYGIAMELQMKCASPCQSPNIVTG